MFVSIGLQPNTGLLRGMLDFNEAGFILSGPTFETSMPLSLPQAMHALGAPSNSSVRRAKAPRRRLIIREHLRGIKDARAAAEELGRDVARMRSPIQFVVRLAVEKESHEGRRSPGPSGIEHVQLAPEEFWRLPYLRGRILQPDR